MITLISYGTKNGRLTPKPDYRFECHKLLNPFHRPELKPLTGKDAAVQEYVGRSALAELLVANAVKVVCEDQRPLTIAFECVGGHHRSVAMVEMTAAKLTELGISNRIQHRDI